MDPAGADSDAGGRDDRPAARRAIGALIAAHVAFWTLVPSLTYRNLPQDTAEGLAWGRLWQFGYDKHPFLAPWLTALFTDGFGVVGWPAFLASQLAVGGCFAYVWRLARTMVGPWDAFAAVAVLEGIHYYTLSSFTFNPNLMMLPTWAAIVFSVRRAVQAPSAARWAVAGLWVGLALVSKYSVLLLIAPLGVALLALPSGRRALAHPGLWAGIAVACAIAAPNVAWLAQHDFLPLRYALGGAEPGLPTAPGPAPHPAWSERLRTAAEFVGEQALTVLPAILLFLAAYGWRRRLRFDVRHSDDVLLLAAVVGPLLVTLLAALLLGSRLVGRWGFPYLSWTGLALLYFTRSPAPPRNAVRRLVAGVIAITLLLAAGNAWIIYIKPQRSGKPPYSILYPGPQLAAEVTTRWEARYQVPLRYVAGPRWLAATVAAYAKDHPAPYFDWIAERNPWLDRADLARTGAAFVLEVALPEDEQRIEALRRRYPQLQGAERLSLPEQSSAPLPAHQFWIAFLPPAATAPDGV